ncbi:hypothetical protein AGABI2DRAFT_182243, partial [Agaricus bisporus var. bisporus H97]|uniref:hypothetical protein n=1 Tax=Agaricus bisporus var. bisporus (strain H97 / ATCC MYA-4626 / FGSC 10389) TaxID=936046 RepID=UPI00029F6C65
MLPLQPFLDALLSSLPPLPISQAQYNSLVKKTLDDSRGKSSPDNRKSQWEYLLKNEVFKLAMTEGVAFREDSARYYEQVKVRLDLVLTFTEQDACEQIFPFIVLQDLLETQTINSCSHIFSWIEARSSRLTEGMVPQKGKALILLRTLNDLLRRLSKSGSTTVFCGRILTFLSGVFPLGERSGVNLRGEYGPTWEDVWYPKHDEDTNAEMMDFRGESSRSDEVPEDNAMQVDSNKETKATPTDFYNTFWHLQYPFSKPSIFANKEAFSQFQEAIDKVLPVIKEATAKERAMMGSRVAAGVVLNKRKREPEPEESNVNEYFFAKFLTSPDLLDLEIADTHFRRQFLFQLMILLQHLLTFTKGTKAAWATQRNRSLQMDFTLEAEDTQWVQDTLSKSMEELKQTTPNGRAFAETTQTILEREKNWVKWKNELCAPFDKEPWSTRVDDRNVGLFEATKELREKMRTTREDWPYTLGSAPLTDIWQMGYCDLHDLENSFQPGDVKDFVKKIKLEDNRIELRRKTLAQIAERQAQKEAPAQAQDAGKEAAGGDAVMSVDAPATPAPTLAAPSSQASSVAMASPLHPSLPPRPNAQSQPLSNSPAPAPASSPAPPAPAPPSPVKKLEALDSQIAKFDENKQRWAWLALRTARDQHLQHFGKIGTGDVGLLVQEIEKERQEREKNVVVTGGAGYIGSHVIYTLQKARQYKVISIDNHHNSQSAALDRVSRLSKSELPENATATERETTEIDAHTCDLTKPEQIRAVFEKYGKGGIWGVVHIAAYKAVGESTEVPLTYYANNVSASVSLLQIMNEYDCRRIVYSSSATVYGTPPIIPIPETTRLEAHSPYGKTKVMVETIIEDLCQSDPRWRAISLRYFNPAGAHPSGLIGEDPRGRPGNLLPLLAQMAVGRVKDTVLKVFGNDYPTPDGTCVRDYLHVLDLSKGHVLALNALAGNSKIFSGKQEAFFKAYNLGKGKGMSVLQIAEAMRKATGFDYKYEIIGRRRGDVPDLTADPALAEKELGFEASQDLETMCRDLWNWQSKNPLGYGEK